MKKFFYMFFVKINHLRARLQMRTLSFAKLKIFVVFLQNNSNSFVTMENIKQYCVRLFFLINFAKFKSN